jgi:transcription initiation factor TFIIB
MIQSAELPWSLQELDEFIPVQKFMNNHNAVCFSCRSSNVITDSDSGEIVCSKCGIVISDKIQENREVSRTFFDAEQVKDRRRTGMPTSLAQADMGLSTVISSHKDAGGYEIEPSMASTMHRLRTWHFRTQASSDRNLSFAFNELRTLKDKLGLPDAIIEKTAYIYRKARQRELARGRSVSALLAAAIYVACRQMGVPRTLDEIAAISNIKRKSIAKCYRQIIFELDLKLPIVDNTKCIARVADRVSISERTKHRAISLMNDLVRSGLSAGKDPMVLAATVVYASCIGTSEQKSQIDVAKAADVTDVTIRNRFKDLKNRLQLNVDVVV